MVFLFSSVEFSSVEFNIYLSPEKFLEEDDAIRVSKAISLIHQYEEEGCDKGFFDRC